MLMQTSSTQGRAGQLPGLEQECERHPNGLGKHLEQQEVKDMCENERLSFLWMKHFQKEPIQQGQGEKDLPNRNLDLMVIAGPLQMK